MKEGIAFSEGHYKLVSYDDNGPKPSNLVFEPPLRSKTQETYSEFILPNNLKICWSHNSWNGLYSLLAEIF